MVGGARRGRHENSHLRHQNRPLQIPAYIDSGVDFGINGAIFDIIYRAKTASSVRNYSKHDFFPRHTSTHDLINYT